MAATRAIVIGIGNPHRGDDAVGREIVRAMRGVVPDGVSVAETDGEPAALLACLEDTDTAWVVDACTSGAPAGTVRRFDVRAAPLPAEVHGFSTHGLGLAEALELARTLGQLPRRCVVYAIEGASFADGAPLSPAVSLAAKQVAAGLLSEIVSAEISGGS